MQVKTLASEKVWQSMDGERTIWNVKVEHDGKQYPLKTFSQQIAREGFEGEVETYVNKRGDRFVKQAWNG
jgi:hypothetical protein